MFTLMVAIMSALPGWQDGTPPDTTQAGSPVQESAGTEAPSAPSAEELRSRVHNLRMDLILGGEQVQRAESEAIGFYAERLELIDRRLDRIDVDLSEKNASYQLALDRTVDSVGASGSGSSIREASRLRAEVVELETEASRLRGKRAQLAALIDSIAERGVDREALAANLEANNVVDMEAGLPMSSIGFGPGDTGATASSPFDDPQLVREIVARDPRRGKAALFDADPVGYWRFFALRPPAAPLRAALEFPLPDLPGTR